MTRISQREARRLRKRVAELESMEDERRMAWKADYPGGILLCAVTVQPAAYAELKTARKLGHACVAITSGDTEVHFYALPLARGGRT